MGEHVRFTVDTEIDGYFCDPHSPWQRGSVEKTNRLLRQDFPRCVDYSPLTEDDLDLVTTNSTNFHAKPSATEHQPKS
jgi:transposase, IS30 family